MTYEGDGSGPAQAPSVGDSELVREERAMKIYLAARWGRRSELRGYRDELEKMGHTVTSRWLDDHDTGDADNAAFVATQDLDDIIDANALIFFGEDPLLGLGKRGGRHVEFGFAFACAPPKTVFLVGPRENVFHYLPSVLWFEQWTNLAFMMEAAAKVMGTDDPKFRINEPTDKPKE